MSNSINLFCYGSLMYPEVWHLIVKDKYQQQQAKVFGYRRKKIKNEEYPGLIASKQEDSIQGTVYFNVSTQDLKRLDLFEGNQYIRVKVNCILCNESYIESYTYIINPHDQTIVEKEDWNQEEFEQNGLKQFLNKYRGFSAF
ncbi:AIG2 family protein [Stanieria cyanosphaera PCC 7437]|uniref:Putative gamma-glutamylcyclotransferase n=1 Tax=Stanieria cyanosphaera (strain ATCC 29371 / PCC 7437) TaxID=111780 RepID=K9XT80_STAC7|nr:gamma-glutamylcyclotransferase family protein [Stanieria cyanosphaera]AFZ35810.1 AIG2 family protein [Stanieria cyanosphaera PCC 7437]